MDSVTPELLRSLPLPQPGEDTDKNTRGTVLVIGASGVSAGAASLSGLAAFRAGAGKVLLAVPRSLSVAISVGFPEAGIHGVPDTVDGDPDPVPAAARIAPLLPRVDVAVIGPGLCNEQGAQQLTRRVLDAAGPAFIVDAMAITGLWHCRNTLTRHRGRLVLTPNAGEMARLIGLSKDEVAGDPAGCAQHAADHLGCIVILKGATTIIAQPDGPAYVHDNDNPGLAVSGSGDVLSGIVGGLMARGTPPLDAALWGVFLHAAAGRLLSARIGPMGFLASELLAEIPNLMRPQAA